MAQTRKKFNWKNYILNNFLQTHVIHQNVRHKSENTCEQVLEFS